jgi:hypothetical protein
MQALGMIEHLRLTDAMKAESPEEASVHFRAAVDWLNPKFLG